MTPQQWLELFLDAEAQTEEWARDQRGEYADVVARGGDPELRRPTRVEAEEMRWLDEQDERRREVRRG